MATTDRDNTRRPVLAILVGTFVVLGAPLLLFLLLGKTPTDTGDAGKKDDQAAELKKAEEARLAEEKTAEEARLAEEKKFKEARLAELKTVGELRPAAKKKIPQDRPLGLSAVNEHRTLNSVFNKEVIYSLRVRFDENNARTYFPRELLDGNTDEAKTKDSPENHPRPIDQAEIDRIKDPAERTAAQELAVKDRSCLLLTLNQVSNDGTMGGNDLVVRYEDLTRELAARVEVRRKQVGDDHHLIADKAEREAAIEADMAKFKIVIHGDDTLRMWRFNQIRAVCAAAGFRNIKAAWEEDETEAMLEGFPDLTEITIGDPERPMIDSIPNERVDDIVVPGPVNPDELPGIDTIPVQRDVITPPKGIGGGGRSVPAVGEPGSVEQGTLGLGIDIPYPASHWPVSGTGAFPGQKEKLLIEGGGNQKSEAAVAAGLQWLALHQAQDGHWSLTRFNQNAREKPYPAGKVFTYNYGNTMGLGLGPAEDDIAGTALALLPFLGAGQTHKASKEEKKVDYHRSVMAGLQYLMRQQNPTTGMLSTNFYSHGIATLALCEAYGMTADPKLLGPAQKALDYIVASQSDAGGWRYRAKEMGDLSVTGWQLMALKTGQMFGLRVPNASLRAAERFVESCEIADKGTYGYLPASGATSSMTAVGILCRMYLGVNPRNPKLAKGIEFLKQTPPTSSDLYYLYYATQVMYNKGGEAWAIWNLGPHSNDGIRDTLIEKMDRSPTDSRTAMLRGSWNYPQGHTATGGRLMSTSLALLSLEVYYRHPPIYRADVTEIKPEK